MPGSRRFTHVHMDIRRCRVRRGNQIHQDAVTRQQALSLVEGAVGPIVRVVDELLDGLRMNMRICGDIHPHRDNRYRSTGGIRIATNIVGRSTASGPNLRDRPAFRHLAAKIVTHLPRFVSTHLFPGWLPLCGRGLGIGPMRAVTTIVRSWRRVVTLRSPTVLGRAATGRTFRRRLLCTRIILPPNRVRIPRIRHGCRRGRMLRWHGLAWLHRRVRSLLTRVRRTEVER